jgi:2'-5' RNA ligase
MEKVRYQFTDDVRFINRDQWHITVTFLGNQEDHTIPAILNGFKAVTEEFEAPEIEFSDISYGPKKGTPSMIWLNGSLKSSKELQPMKDFLENSMVDHGVVFKREHRQLSIHITLARLMTTDDLPELNIPFERKFSAPTLDLMESQPTKDGVVYEFLQKTPFRI